MALVVYSAKSPHVEDLKRAAERTFRLGDRLLTLKQAWKPGGDGGTALGHGASVYDAAFVLADYLHRKPVALKDMRVVELGCGPGLGAVAAGLLGAAEVVATDGDEELLNLTAQNLDLNLESHSSCGDGGASQRSRCRCVRLLWGDSGAAAALNPPFDIVLAADCAALVYSGAFEDLAASLAHLSNRGSNIILSYHRRHKSEDDFFALLNKSFEVHRAPPEAIHPDFYHSDISIFEIRKRA